MSGKIEKGTRTVLSYLPLRDGDHGRFDRFVGALVAARVLGQNVEIEVVYDTTTDGVTHPYDLVAWASPPKAAGDDD